jgi:hypothetical protein
MFFELKQSKKAKFIYTYKGTDTFPSSSLDVTTAIRQKPFARLGGSERLRLLPAAPLKS